MTAWRVGYLDVDIRTVAWSSSYKPVSMILDTNRNTYIEYWFEAVENSPLLLSYEETFEALRRATAVVPVG